MNKYEKSYVILVYTKAEMQARKKMNVMGYKQAMLLVIFALVAGLYVTGAPLLLTKKLHSANLTAVSVLLSTSKLSYKGILAAGNTLASSVVTIANTGAPSISTTNLFTGDSVRIGDLGTASLYTVTGIPTSTQFQLGSGLDSTDFQTGDLVYATRSAVVTTKFITASAIANGAFRILIPAAATTSNDGIPDHTGFDFGVTVPTVTCPTNNANYAFTTGTASPAAVTVNSVLYHSYTCRYSGAGAVGQDFRLGNNVATISAVINPAAAGGHAEGTADQYRIIVQNTTGTAGGDTVIDSTAVGVAPIEGVRVTASVDPTLQFSIAGVVSSGVSGSFCNVTGQGVTVDTTAVNGNTLPNVPLGTIAIGTFTNAMQLLTVSTNAANGYSVTAVENDQLKTTTAACADAGSDGYGAGFGCIPDTTGALNGGTGTDWTSTATKGFGYSQYSTAVPASAMAVHTTKCGGTFCARKFADNQNGEPPEVLFFSTTVRDTDAVNLCYRAVVGPTQEAGNYENNITYTATAVF